MASDDSIDYKPMRRWPRYAVDVRVKVTVLGTDGVSKQYHGRGSNISVGGMALYIPMDVIVGQKIKLNMTLPYSDREIQCEAIVSNRESYLCGLEFVPLSAADRDYITRTCTALSFAE